MSLSQITCRCVSTANTMLESETGEQELEYQPHNTKSMHDSMFSGIWSLCAGPFLCVDGWIQGQG